MLLDKWMYLTSILSISGIRMLPSVLITLRQLLNYLAQGLVTFLSSLKENVACPCLVNCIITSHASSAQIEQFRIKCFNPLLQYNYENSVIDSIHLWQMNLEMEFIFIIEERLRQTIHQDLKNIWNIYCVKISLLNST